MQLEALAISALLLSAERLCYVWAWRGTKSFVSFCELPWLARFGKPPAVLERLFYLFKAIQFGVFLGWCAVHGGVEVWPAEPAWATLAGAAALAIGQTFNVAVFQRLGRTGVFYGNRLGCELPWIEGFPFSLVPHPQYVGTVLSIWGFFLITRFPHPDWIALPLLETLYYWIGAHLES